MAREGRRVVALVLMVGLAGAPWAWAGDGVVALQTADASCRSTTTPPPRYVDCGNGTVTDNDTGLVWLKNANCIFSAGGSLGVDWDTAMEFVAGLSDLPGVDLDDCGLEDGSSPGEWRLPSKAEWQAMVAEAVALVCSPTITNDFGNGCWAPACVTAGDCSFSGVASSNYWSSSTYASNTSFAWGVGFFTGSVYPGPKDDDQYVYVWPVRGGQ